MTQQAKDPNKRAPVRTPRRTARGIGQGEVITGATDVCVPIWAALIIGGLAAYGTVKAVNQ
jgi:hypothetical protein